MKSEKEIFESGSNYALFAYSKNGCGEDIEQLTFWDCLSGAIKSKDSWFEKDRHLFYRGSNYEIHRIDNS